MYNLLSPSGMVHVFATHTVTCVCSDTFVQIHVWFVAAQVDSATAVPRQVNYKLSLDSFL